MNVTRRDFINGVSVAVVAGMSPFSILEAKNGTKNTVYPPALTGLRGSTDESYKFAHMMRDGDKFDANKLPIEENYDLIVVGAGISGLTAACVFQDRKGRKAKILILDNHDDFGGHARRNEFKLKDRTILSYGGSESLQSPKALYSKEVVKFLATLGIDIDKLAKAFNVNFYPDLGLSRGVYFSAKDFGVDKVVSGNPRRMIADDIPETKINGRTFEAFIGDFPMDEADKQALIEFHTDPKDYLEGMNVTERMEYASKTSYKNFLKDKVKLSSKAISFFEGMTDDFLALGIDSICCNDARAAYLPGFDNMKLKPLSKTAEAEISEPYIYHFPDGNATIVRAMVKKLIPDVAVAKNIEEIVMARFDYSKLDLPKSPARLRLNSTVVKVKNTKRGADVFYISANDGKVHRVSAQKVVMANYNSSIPYIVPEMSEVQKEALAQNVKTPLIHTKVILRNWESFKKLGVHEIFTPKGFYARTKLDYPVDIGAYAHPRDPKEPICVHMVSAPIASTSVICEAGGGDVLNAREQARLGRYYLIEMPFSEHEKIIREQLQGMLGEAGFDHQRDILAITLNRWGHCYSYTFNSLYDNKEQSDRTIKLARKVHRNIAVANSDADWDAYAHAAMEQAFRALKDLGI